VSDEVRRLTTDEQRERFHRARRTGGLCAACGRSLGDDETVFVEPLLIGPADGPATRSYGAVGIECASSELRYDVQGREPERCAGCGRGVYYRVASARRQWVSCSRRCANRAGVARHREAKD
jgi:hypothetical protein